MGPSLNQRDELRTVDSHPPIVESASASAAAAGARAFRWRDETATAAFAQALARQAALRNAYVELHGDLGAGKTTFVRHLLRALGVAGRIKSPTYAVVEPHDVPGLDIWHFDFYRFTDPREWEDAGFRELFAAPGLKLAEWPERAAAWLPCADLALTLTAQPDGTRDVVARASTPAGQALLQALPHDGLQNQAGHGAGADAAPTEGQAA